MSHENGQEFEEKDGKFYNSMLLEFISNLKTKQNSEEPNHYF